MKQRMAACRQSARDAVKHPADGLGEIFTMDESNQSILSMTHPSKTQMARAHTIVEHVRQGPFDLAKQVPAACQCRRNRRRAALSRARPETSPKPPKTESTMNADNLSAEQFKALAPLSKRLRS